MVIDVHANSQQFRYRGHNHRTARLSQTSRLQYGEGRTRTRTSNVCWALCPFRLLYRTLYPYTCDSVRSICPAQPSGLSQLIIFDSSTREPELRIHSNTSECTFDIPSRSGDGLSVIRWGLRGGGSRLACVFVLFECSRYGFDMSIEVHHRIKHLTVPRVTIHRGALQILEIDALTERHPASQ
jgi:hypothetical protein